MKLYQSYVNLNQKKHISNVATPFDASWNTSGNEYELFKSLKTKSASHNDEPWGLVSWKFAGKCQISPTEFLDFAADHLRNGYDCVFINPMIGNEALYLNVWEQGKDCGHQGMEIVEPFLKNNHDTNITAMMGSKVFAFCNYFVASNIFWGEYFNYIDNAMLLLENEATRNSAVGVAYSSSAGYFRNMSQTLHPFIIERLFSSFILTTKLRSIGYNHSENDFQNKFGKMLGHYLFNLSILKNEALNQENSTLFKNYLSERSNLLNTDYKRVIWGMDDPNNLLY